MALFRVTAQVTHTAEFLVEADNEDEAREQVLAGGGDEQPDQDDTERVVIGNVERDEDESPLTMTDGEWQTYKEGR